MKQDKTKKTFKKKLLILIFATVLLLAILFVPIPHGVYPDGTRVYYALTYQIVDWHREGIDGVFDETRIYFGANSRKTLEQLWTMEWMEMMEEKREQEDDCDSSSVYKPVIYLYPEAETEVSVKLRLNGEFTCTYPRYADGWRVTASPDGRLTDACGMEYSYLYWEAELVAAYDFTRGFCVKGEDTAEFLEAALESLGLTRREANEFIIFWLPMMEKNPYNLIFFQGVAYTDAASLEITPAPDTLLRVFMAWQASDGYVDLPPQELTSPERVGFTVVEWGGTEVK